MSAIKKNQAGEGFRMEDAILWLYISWKASLSKWYFNKNLEEGRECMHAIIWHKCIPDQWPAKESQEQQGEQKKSVR